MTQHFLSIRQQLFSLFHFINHLLFSSPSPPFCRSPLFLLSGALISPLLLFLPLPSSFLSHPLSYSLFSSRFLFPSPRPSCVLFSLQSLRLSSSPLPLPPLFSLSSPHLLLCLFALYVGLHWYLSLLFPPDRLFMCLERICLLEPLEKCCRKHTCFITVIWPRCGPGLVQLLPPLL